MADIKRRRESRRRWYIKHKAENPDKHRDWRMRSRYGITLMEWKERFKSQDGRCAICRSEKELVIDHNHRTGKARSLLCRACNLMIGYAHEDYRILEAATQYLLWSSTDFGGCGKPNCELWDSEINKNFSPAA